MTRCDTRVGLEAETEACFLFFYIYKLSQLLMIPDHSSSVSAHFFLLDNE